MITDDESDSSQSVDAPHYILVGPDSRASFWSLGAGEDREVSLLAPLYDRKRS